MTDQIATKNVISGDAVIIQQTQDWDVEGDYGQSQVTVAAGGHVTVLHVSPSVANAHYALSYKTPKLAVDEDLTDYAQKLLDSFNVNEGEDTEAEKTRDIVVRAKMAAEKFSLTSTDITTVDGANIPAFVKLESVVLEDAGQTVWRVFDGCFVASCSSAVEGMLPTRLLDANFVSKLKPSIK